MKNKNEKACYDNTVKSYDWQATETYCSLEGIANTLIMILVLGALHSPILLVIFLDLPMTNLAET